MKTCALIPAYKEAARIGGTVLALRSRKEIDYILVVDDGSADDTAKIAREAGADTVLRLERNGGKGAALTVGYKAAPGDCGVFLLLDADLGPSATESLKLLAPIRLGKADMTIGMLPPDPALAASGKKGGGSGLVVRLARWGILRKTGKRFVQPLSGQRAIRREVLESIDGKFGAGFGAEIALTVAVLGKGFRVLEVDTSFRHRVTGNDWADFVHRGRQFVDVARAVMR